MPGATLASVEASRGAGVRRAVLASTVGTSIEWYDFILYSIATTLVFPRAFFPASNPLAGELQSSAIFAVGFLARPVGAVLFGHWGDRLGRKSSLVATLLLMGLGTLGVAFLPTYEQGGNAGAVILVLLRFLQGVGVGGEWSGAVLVAMEWAPPGRRGFYASWPQVGVPLGLILANLAFGAASLLGGDAFGRWAWRLPFAASGLLVVVGLLIRLGVGETPVFRELAARRALARRPVLAALRGSWRQILLTALLRVSEMSNYQVMTVFVFVFARDVLHLPRTTTLLALLCAALLAVLCIPLFGALSDRLGHRRTFMAGVALTGLFGFAYFGLLSTGSAAVAFAAIAVSLVPHALQYGPEAAFITGSYAAGTRYSGSAIGYQLASLVAAPVPLITVALFAYDRSGTAIAAYLALCALVSLGAAWFLRPVPAAAGA